MKQESIRTAILIPGLEIDYNVLSRECIVAFVHYALGKRLFIKKIDIRIMLIQKLFEIDSFEPSLKLNNCDH